ncbi:CHASE2 domain-containing protein [Kaarinaea lacus]
MNTLVGQWPWPRSVFAEIIEFISLGEPKAILFDLLFVENQVGTDGDTRLIEATKQAGLVYHAMQLVSDNEDSLNTCGLNTPLPIYIS